MKNQKSYLGKTTSSVTNWLMGNNNTLPEVGKGATLLFHTDRYAYEVMEVSKDGKRVLIQEYDAERIDNNGMSESQQYKYEKLNGRNETIVWRNGSWKKEFENIEYTKEFSEWIENNWEEWSKTDKSFLYDENGDIKLIEGKTCLKKRYEKISVLWGHKEKYHDYSF